MNPKQEVVHSPTFTPAKHFFSRTVTCAWCNNRYRSAVPPDIDRGLQGCHCASDVVHEGGQWIVRGGYGSDEHDMHRYVFIANPPSAPAAPVCDECISQCQEAGDLRQLSPEDCRRPGDFSPRPLGTHALVTQIRRLLEEAVVLRKVVDAACKDHDIAHETDENGVPYPCACDVCAAVREYRKYQRWQGEIDDGGETYEAGAPEVASQMRAAASALEKLAVFWEGEAETK